METRWRIQLLGELRADSGDRVVSRFRSQKTAALLAYLAYYLRRAHPREVLIDLFWPESDPERARQSLSMALTSLRRQLEPPGVPRGAVLVAERTALRLNPLAVTTDVVEFEAALRAAGAARSATERAQCLARAVALYEGPLLPGYYEDWVLQEQPRLAERYFQAVTPLIRHLEETGDLPEAIQHACRAVAADPLREEVQYGLIRLYAIASQPAAALRQYRELERILREELDQAPAAATRALAEEIRKSGVQVGGVEDGGPPGRPSPPESLNARKPERLNAFPTGTVTFLGTEIERSTAQAERGREGFQRALAAHHARLRQEFRRYGGCEVKESGDGFLVAFAGAGDAVACAVACQRALAAQAWPEAAGAIRVRMAVHTVDVDREGGGYRGLALSQASRMVAAANGGQIVCSEITAGLLRRGALGNVEGGVRLVELGFYGLRDVPAPERLFQVNYPEMPEREFPPLHAEAASASRLPLQFTRFFGREEEILRLQQMLAPCRGAEQPASRAGHRLVTLTGPGGSGKTRLALAVAGRLLEPFQGAVWFVPLVDVAAPERLADAVRDALRIPRSARAEALEQVVAVLARQPSLLLLDTFEHLVVGGAPFVRMLLERLPALTCLITSRQRLNLEGEREFAVGPLPTPGSGQWLMVDGQRSTVPGVQPSTINHRPSAINHPPSPERLMECPSVQLFVDRAQGVRADFQVTRANAAAVAVLCDRLEGLPLSLELAAARAAALSPSQMLAQLEHRFDFLVSRQRGAGERHRSLRVAVDWSYRLLPPDLQRFFRRLAVFRGGFALEAAEAVSIGVEVSGWWGVGPARAGEGRVSSDAGAPLAAPRSDPAPDTSTPQLLNTPIPNVLEYLEQLQECSLVEVEEAGEEIRYRLLDTLREYGWERLREAGEERVVRGRHLEFFARFAEQAAAELEGPRAAAWLDRLEQEHQNLQAALVWAWEAGMGDGALRLAVAIVPFWEIRNHWGVAREHLARALGAAPGRTQTRVRALLALGRAQMVDGAGSAPCEEALSIARELGDKPGMVESLNRLAAIAFMRGDLATARERAEESLETARALECPRALVRPLHSLATILHHQGDDETAWDLYRRCLELERQVGMKREAAATLSNLGELARQRGEYAASRAFQEEGVAVMRELGDTRSVAWGLWALANLAQTQRDWDRARSLYEEALAVVRELHDMRQVAGCLTGLGEVAEAQGDPARAWKLYEEALALQRTFVARQDVASMLCRFGRLCETGGEPERAARLFGAAMALHEACGWAMAPTERARHEPHIASARAALGEAAFAAAWSAGRAMTLEQAIDCALSAGPLRGGAAPFPVRRQR